MPISRAQRRAAGIYYTPPEIAVQLARLTLALRPQAENALRVLDPACGDGELLAAVMQIEPAARLHGIDIDPHAVESAGQRMAIRADIRCGDALVQNVFPNEQFDVIVANPPYVNVRQLARQRSRAEIDALKKRFLTARGHFDLYVLFIERCLELLRPGGRCGLLIPDKWATADYARPCRELLLSQAAIDDVIDLADRPVFGRVKVHPQMVIFTKRTPASEDVVSFRRGAITDAAPQRTMSGSLLRMGIDLEVERRVATVPLGEIAHLSCGTAGYRASRMAAALRNATVRTATEGVPYRDFITSGNIDRYRIELGNVRFQGRRIARPAVSLDHESLTARQRKLFAAPKIVIAGMSRRLEAAWDERGLALGVQVFAATDFKVDPFYLLALLNSKLLSYFFRTRFAAKRLADGYLAINKGQIAQLPIGVVKSLPHDNVQHELARLAARLCHSDSDHADLDSEIDRLVYQLYRLSPEESADVDQQLAVIDVPPQNKPLSNCRSIGLTQSREAAQRTLRPERKLVPISAFLPLCASAPLRLCVK